MDSLTIEHVPKPIREKLAKRASEAGRSLQDFLLDGIISMAEEPTFADQLAEARALARSKGIRLSPEDIVAMRDEDRR